MPDRRILIPSKFIFQKQPADRLVSRGRSISIGAKPIRRSGIKGGSEYRISSVKSSCPLERRLAWLTDNRG
ncbi:MAG TPA: hypothetical protein DC042_10210 [Bacteroidales bacterium]|nr:hypothetical protein [Bacteroidales bacterium]